MRYKFDLSYHKKIQKEWGVGKINTVIMIGRLTKDPELRFISGSGKAVATFAIAVDRPFAKEKTADFFNVVVWGKPAENVANYLSKGREVAVKGYLQTRNYEGTDGVKRYVTEIVADQVQFIGGANKAADPAEDGLNTNYEDEGFQSIEDDDDILF